MERAKPQRITGPWRLADLPDMPKNGLTAFSCFHCGGGSTMGYKLAGFQVLGGVEIDPERIELHDVATKPIASTWAWPDVEVWAWVDATADHDVQSVVKATAGTRVLMPWQDAATAYRWVFIPGLDD